MMYSLLNEKHHLKIILADCLNCTGDLPEYFSWLSVQVICLVIYLIICTGDLSDYFIRISVQVICLIILSDYLYLYRWSVWLFYLIICTSDLSDYFIWLSVQVICLIVSPSSGSPIPSRLGVKLSAFSRKNEIIIPVCNTEKQKSRQSSSTDWRKSFN